MTTYDPYTYNPMLRAYFVTSNFTNMPDKAAKLAAERPDLAKHINSVWSFLEWMKKSNNALYNAITNKRPDLVDSADVVLSGQLAVKPAKTGLKGMEDADMSDDTDVQTSWGQNILATIKSVVPTYFQFQTQKDLMQLNIKRAEQGLPPIDSGTLAPTVNVGVSKNVQQLGMLAVGGLIVVGLLSALKRK